MSEAAQAEGNPATPKKETGGKKGGQSGARAFAPRAPKFEGKCPELKGYVYDAADSRQSDQFVKTSREIAEYVGRTYKYGGDIRLAVETLKPPSFRMPDDPPEGATKTALKIWDKDIDEYSRAKSKYAENVKTLFSLVWGQCTDVMRQKVEATKMFETINKACDGIGLLLLLKAIAFQFQGQKYLPHAIHEALKRYYNCAQGKFSSTQAYMDHFQNTLDVVLHCKATVSEHPGIEDLVMAERTTTRETISNEELAEVKAEVFARSTAIAFILGCDRARYGKLLDDLENDFLQGQNRYPPTVVAAYNLVTNWKQENRFFRGPSADGVAFANVDRDFSHITCHKCHKKGHYATACPERGSKGSDNENQTQTGTTLLMSAVADGDFDTTDKHFQFLQDGTDGVTCQIGQDGRLPKSWILLDNQSTVDVFCNATLLTNVRTGNGSMMIHCNAGVATTNQVGDLPGYGTVWYHPNGIANILSLARVKEHGYRVTYDSDGGNHFTVHKSDGTSRVFKESNRGLYYFDTNEDGGHTGYHKDDMGNDEMVMVNTVANKKSSYTNRAYSRAVTARNIQKMIGRPSTKEFIQIVERNLLPNCPINRADIMAAEDIFGPDIGSLKGKTVRQRTDHVEIASITIPSDLMSRYSEVIIGADIMYVNKLPFMVTISRNIKFSTAELILDQKHETLLSSIKSVRNLYLKRGFVVKTILMDGQFEVLRGDLAGLNITLNTVARGEHVPEVERHIRTIKERARSVFNTLPFRKIPGRMIAELIYLSIFWLNSFPARDGVSDTLSPRAIVVGASIDFTKHVKLEYGTYVQAHEEHDNSMATRTTGAIALRPTGNAQGGYYFYSLSTGRVLNRTHWTALPMPHEVIDRVHALARRSAAALTFADRDRIVLPDDDDDDDDDGDYAPNDDDSDDDDADIEFDDIAGVLEDDDSGAYDDDDGGGADDDDDDGNIPIPDNNHYPHIDVAFIDEPNDVAFIDEPNEPNDGDNDNDTLIPTENDDGIAEDIVTHAEATNDNDHTNNASTEAADDNEAPEGIEGDEVPDTTYDDDEEDAKYGTRSRRYDLRPRKPRDYSHLHTTLEHTVLTQYSLKRGLAEFGDEAVTAVLKELLQLHDRGVIEPKEGHVLTREEKRAALQYLMFLKRKRNGTLKGRGCADGRKQRLHTTKEEASSPTVAIESVFLSCVIDAIERRDVATIDIPGAFMQADMDDIVHMRLEGKMAELLVRIDPKLYRKYVRDEGGKQVLYVELRKALYGTLKAALLFWRLLTSKLTAWGFVVNPYDSCVMNKDINGKQCTILWHVDDLKISHVDPEVVTSVIDLLDAEFGKEAPLTKTRGKIHDYLGMTIDFSEDGKVKFSMIDYVENMLKVLPDDMGGEAATPAAPFLFDVNEMAEKLDDKTADLFHHNTAKLLFLCKRARPDTQTAVAFLCTRVQAPDVDDYKKLTRVMKYLRGTKTMPLVLESDGTNIIKWWADASYAVHPDMRSHTGGAMSLGKGTVYGTSSKQKLNTKSSTEAELVGVNDVMPQVLWTRYFLEAQGFSISDSIVYQDNQSAILLEKNGKASSGKRTRHINIRYFFVTDRVANQEVSIAYCPTKLMLADYFTKPLQGAAFKTFRDQIMNYNPDFEPHQDYRSVLENELAAGQTDDGWTMVQPKSATESGLIVARLAKQVIKSVNEHKQDLDPFTKKDHVAKQGKTYAAVVMANVHGRDQNDHVRDYFYDEGFETARLN